MTNTQQISRHDIARIEGFKGDTNLGSITVKRTIDGDLDIQVTERRPPVMMRHQGFTYPTTNDLRTSVLVEANGNLKSEHSSLASFRFPARVRLSDIVHAIDESKKAG